MCKFSLRNPLLVLTLLVLILPILTMSQEKTIEKKVKVLQRLTDIVVRDKDGNFVTDLNPQDIILKVNGEETKVRSLQMFEAQNPLEPSLVEFSTEYRKAKENNQVLPEPPIPPRNIILLFDCYYSRTQNIKESKKLAIDMLDSMILPHDRVSVFMYNKSLKNLAGPSTNREEILAAIGEVSVLSSDSMNMPDWKEVVPPIDRQDIMDHTQIYMQKQIHYRRYLKTLTQLAKIYSSMPGRKSYMIFSDGPNIFNPLEQSPTLIANIQVLTQGQLDVQRTGVITQMRTDFLDDLEKAARSLSDSSSSIYYIRRGQVIPQWMDNLSALVSMNDDPKIRLLKEASPTFHLDRPKKMFESQQNAMRELSNLSGGKFYDAGATRENLYQSLIDELGNYYEIAFSTSLLEKDKFYSLDISVKNHPEYQVSHRKGFFGHQAFSEMPNVHTALLSLGGFSRGAIKNDLGIHTKIYVLPANEGVGALYFAQIDVSNLTVSSNGMYQLDHIVAVEDSQERLRFYNHRKFSSSQPLNGQKYVYISDVIPLANDLSRVSILFTESSTGKQSNAFSELKTNNSTQNLFLTEPIFFSDQKMGNLEDWNAADIDDQIGVFSPISYSGISIPGIPNYGNEFEQGSFTRVMLLVGNLKELPERSQGLEVKFLADSGGSVFRLKPLDQKGKLLTNSRCFVYMATIPVGYIPGNKTKLRVEFSGLSNIVLSSSVEVEIPDYSETKAHDLLSSDLITEYTGVKN